jgi:hypothetical protein
MRKFLLAVGIAGAVAAAGTLLPSRADAMTSGSAAGIGLAIDALNVVDTVQFVYGGRRHCWYATGWKGPGWYWCGYANRVGFGWGGGPGYRGWAYPGGPAVVVKPRPRGPKVIIRP